MRTSEVKMVTSKGKVKKSDYGPTLMLEGCTGARIELPPAEGQTGRNQDLFLLTSAHCFVEKDEHSPLFLFSRNPFGDLSIFAGSGRQEKNGKDSYRLAIKKIYIPEGYFSTGGVQEDVALIRFAVTRSKFGNNEEQEQFLNKVPPGILDFRTLLPLDRIRIGGYGSQSLKFVDGDFVEERINPHDELHYDTEFIAEINQSNLFTEARIARSGEITRSIAHADSGGPVYLDQKDNTEEGYRSIVGVNTAARVVQQNPLNFRNVFTRISHLKSWFFASFFDENPKSREINLNIEMNCPNYLTRYGAGPYRFYRSTSGRVFYFPPLQLRQRDEFPRFLYAQFKKEAPSKEQTPPFTRILFSHKANSGQIAYAQPMSLDDDQISWSIKFLNNDHEKVVCALKNI